MRPPTAVPIAACAVRTARQLCLYGVSKTRKRRMMVVIVLEEVERMGCACQYKLLLGKCVLVPRSCVGGVNGDRVSDVLLNASLS